MNQELETLSRQYFALLDQQEFDPAGLDYSILDRHRIFLEQLATVENSGITVFDLYKKEHVLTPQLSISVHTVNTHRQRILEKLKAGNSLEAVRYASELGLLD